MPCAIVLVKTDVEDGRHVVTVVPITHTPKDETRGVLVPAKAARQLGLDEDSCWIAMDEMNRFVWPGPDLKPISQRGPGVWTFGVLPADIFDQMKQVINRLRAERGIAVMKRDDDVPIRPR